MILPFRNKAKAVFSSSLSFFLYLTYLMTVYVMNA